jgi:hypothetical protein
MPCSGCLDVHASHSAASRVLAVPTPACASIAPDPSWEFAQFSMVADHACWFRIFLTRRYTTPIIRISWQTGRPQVLVATFSDFLELVDLEDGSVPPGFFSE